MDQNKIKIVLYVDHTRPEPNPEKISYNYNGNNIIIYTAGHGEKALGVFCRLYKEEHKKIDLIIEDSTDSYVSRECIIALKKIYKFRGHHKFVAIANEHIEKISGKPNPEEKLFLESVADIQPLTSQRESISPPKDSNSTFSGWKEAFLFKLADGRNFDVFLIHEYGSIDWEGKLAIVTHGGPEPLFKYNNRQLKSGIK